MGYLTNFIVYTFAMVGVIVLALVVYKNANNIGNKSGAKYLKVHDTLSLGPRKTLYIVSAGEEKFLIAGDVDRTTLISKLEVKDKPLELSKPVINNIIEDNLKSTREVLNSKSSYMDRGNIGIYSTQEKPYDSVMKNLAERLRDVTKWSNDQVF